MIETEDEVRDRRIREVLAAAVPHLPKAPPLTAEALIAQLVATIQDLKSELQHAKRMAAWYRERWLDPGQWSGF